MPALNPVKTIDPRNREDGAPIRRMHEEGKDVLDELVDLEKIADYN